MREWLDQIKEILPQFSRLKWLIGTAAVAVLAALFLGIGAPNIGLIVFKFLIFCPAVALVHMVRIQLLPYLDMSEEYKKDTAFGTARFAVGVYFIVKMTEILVSAI